MEGNSVTYDLLKSIHNEMKIAVQNHQLLVLRKKMCPTDPDVESHINVIQGLIISLGRSQAELLSQLRREPGFPDLKMRLQNSPYFLPKGVPCSYLPKHIPIYKFNNTHNNIINNNNEKDKKMGILKYNRKDAIIQFPKVIQQSLLKIKGGKTPMKKEFEQKIIDTTKIKLLYNKKSDEQSILKHPKQQMSILKSKNEKGKELISNCDESLEKLVNEKSDPLSPTDVNSQLKTENASSISTYSTNGVSKLMKISPSRSSSYSDESEINDSQEKPSNHREPKLVKKYDTRFLRKKKYSALFTSDLKKSSMKTDSEGNKIDGDSSGNEANEFKPLLPEEMGQEVFLNYFGLVSKAKGDVLKRKRCERKRRSVAGQSSLYSDYYQPTSQSKRTYSKKSTSSPTSPTNQVIVETAADVDDEDEKPKYCLVCNETGLMEMCQSCSASYHESCKPNPANGCPNCSPQPTDISSIVGANYFGSSSSYEIIKRYSVTTNDPSEANKEENVQKSNGENSGEC